MIDFIVENFLMFFVFSVIGFITEVSYVYINTGNLVNRGFMYGPYVPIYGIGALLIIWLLNRFKSYPLLVFIFGTIICSILEYSISFLMEKIFNNRWWDYSQMKYNLNGRICLQNSILFGLGALLVIYFLYPLYQKVIAKVDLSFQRYLVVFIFIIFFTDFILSFKAALKLNHITLSSLPISNRLTKAFPNLKKIVNFKKI